jgi:hypothetical protein
MRKIMAGLAVATLLTGLAAAPLALAQGEGGQAPMTGGDMMEGMQGMEGMMGMMQMMEACTKMMQAMADQPKTPTTPQTEQQGG